MPETAPSGIPQGEGGGVCGAAGSSDAATGESAAISSTSHASASRTAVRSSASRHCGANTRTHCRVGQQPLRFSRDLLRSGSHASTSRTAVRSSAYGTAGRTPAHTAESGSSCCACLEIASLATEPATGRPPKVRACGARDCSEWNPAGRGRRSLWRRGLERCCYGRPGAAGSSDAATAVPAPRARAIPLRLSRFCARERCRYRRPAQKFGQNYSRIGHFNSNCSD